MNVLSLTRAALFPILLSLSAGLWADAPMVMRDSEPTWKELDTNSFYEAKQLKAILKTPESEIDLAKAKLSIDKLVDPSIDVPANLAKLDAIVAAIKAMLPANAADSDKLNGIRRYLYEAGSWNGNKAYSYDLDDPLGTKITNKLLPHYLETRKGNCVSMPLLFVILGQRLGLNVTASTAPLHIFVKYTDRQTQQSFNIEATSGGAPARDEWIRKQIPMTDASIESGLYMQPLTRKETVAIMALTLAEYYSSSRQYKKAVHVSDLILESHPKNADSMVRKSFCFSQLIQKEFVDKYSTPQQIPAIEKEYYAYLESSAQEEYARASELGWKAPDAAQDAAYTKRVENVKTKTN